MKVDVEAIEGGKADLLIEVEPERIESYLDKAYNKIRGKVRVPGFRPGKAPRFIFERFMGRAGLLEDALKMVMPDTFHEAMNKVNLKPFREPKMEVLEFESGKPLKFKAQVLIRPEVILPEPESLVVAEEKRKASPEEVDAELQRLRERFAELEPVEDRPAMPGDVVYLTASPVVDGVPLEPSPRQMEVELGAGTAPPGFDRELQGVKPGDEKKIVSSYPDDHPDPELAGKVVIYQVKVEDIKQKIVPELNDEFAGMVGGFSSLQELREHVENTLNELYSERSSKEFAERVVDAVVSASSVEVPPALIDARAEEMLEDLKERVERSGTLDEYLKDQGKTLDELRREMREAAEKSLKRELVLDAVVEKYNIEVPREELERVVSDAAEAQGRDPKEFLALLNAGGFKELRASLARAKAAERLVGLVQKTAQ